MFQASTKFVFFYFGEFEFLIFRCINVSSSDFSSVHVMNVFIKDKVTVHAIYYSKHYAKFG